MKKFKAIFLVGPALWACILFEMAVVWGIIFALQDFLLSTPESYMVGFFFNSFWVLLVIFWIGMHHKAFDAWGFPRKDFNMRALIMYDFFWVALFVATPFLIDYRIITAAVTLGAFLTFFLAWQEEVIYLPQGWQTPLWDFHR